MDSSYSNEISHGTSSIQGRRPHMEDFYQCIMPDEICSKPDKWAYFFVFDGHGGDSVAKYCQENFVKQLVERLQKSGKDENSDKDLIEKDITEFCYDFDEEIKKNVCYLNEIEFNETVGTTVCGVIVNRKNFIFINIGDSRAAMIREENVFQTRDHKPMLADEFCRIYNAKSSVWLNKVNGMLALSRAFGDFHFKDVESATKEEQPVICEPEIYFLERGKSEDLMVIGTDGLWDKKTSFACLLEVNNQKDKLNTKEIAEKLTASAYSKVS